MVSLLFSSALPYTMSLGDGGRGSGNGRCSGNGRSPVTGRDPINRFSTFPTRSANSCTNNNVCPIACSGDNSPFSHFNKTVSKLYAAIKTTSSSLYIGFPLTRVVGRCMIFRTFYPSTYIILYFYLLFVNILPQKKADRFANLSALYVKLRI